MDVVGHDNWTFFLKGEAEYTAFGIYKLPIRSIYNRNFVIQKSSLRNPKKKQNEEKTTPLAILGLPYDSH